MNDTSNAAKHEHRADHTVTYHTIYRRELGANEINPYTYKGQMHNSVLIVERCNCGATRTTELSGDYHNASGWLVPDTYTTITRGETNDNVSYAKIARLSWALTPESAERWVESRNVSRSEAFRIWSMAKGDPNAAQNIWENDDSWVHSK